ncbi:DUF4301 family protein [Ekhidna sp. To15]|uniref:DUF4301 family protein n=1 Tax=Ekhidna sp. To15 TaxID=3395267 RepID=UPI003F51C20D
MNTNTKFSEEDLALMEFKGISLEDVELQLQRFKNGFPPVEILAPATIGNGIVKLSREDLDKYIQLYETTKVDVLKFVPASGAATRMFKSLFSFLEKFDGTRDSFDRILNEEKQLAKFFEELNEFAFYQELNQVMLNTKGLSTHDARKECKHHLIVESLLLESGLNYGNLPKGMLSFHRYENNTRTAAQEHLAEGLEYAEKNGKVHLHFTVSPNHLEVFSDHINESIAQLKAETEINVSFSVQYPNTDTIAATLSHHPFRDEKGSLVFRPAGHGALLENLNSLSSDLIYIKNIDNVVPDRMREEVVKYKKALGGLLINFQNKSFSLLRRADAGDSINEEGTQLLKEMGIVGAFSEKEVKSLLDRPIRVCGMVKNEGELGGGPFWVKGEKYQSLQIVESAQVKQASDKQLSIFNSGTHFNPVDIICGVKNYKGQKYNLLEYRDAEAGFISEKSFNGDNLLAMELPGLWNGGMANWNTVFVEVPQVTFNPVKRVTDLLKPIRR